MDYDKTARITVGVVLGPIIVLGRLFVEGKKLLFEKQPKPMVIDSFTDSDQEVKPGQWAIAKPLNFKKPFSPLKMRAKHAYYVLTGDATAVRFAEDVIKQENTDV